MNKVLIFIALQLFALQLSAQNKADKKKKKDLTKTNVEYSTASGLKYIIKEVGTGQRAQAGDLVTVHYTGRLTNDSVFDSSIGRGPFKFKLGTGQVIKGWDEGIALLNVGDKARFTIPPDLGYGEKGAGNAIPPNATLIFDVELLSIAQKPVPFDTKGKDTIKLESGLKIILIEKVINGKSANPGQTVQAHYTGYFTDGKIFDSSVERDQPFEFPVGQGRVIRGWDETFMLLREGEKARIIIPYQLAYGEQGRPPVIPQKADLIFDVQLLQLK
jgi:peptidylprolyl isomerase